MCTISAAGVGGFIESWQVIQNKVAHAFVHRLLGHPVCTCRALQDMTLHALASKHKAWGQLRQTILCHIFFFVFSITERTAEAFHTYQWDGLHVACIMQCLLTTCCDC